MTPTADLPLSIDAAALRSDPNAQRVRKRPRAVSVDFAAEDQIIATREGDVPATRGDAIITGTRGERWPVARARFDAKYEPVPPALHGEPGSYRPRPLTVLALRMGVPFRVAIDGGRAHLEGAPGDWALDYGDGSLGVVASAVFDDTYEHA
jgi:hypothetical protein